MDLFFYVFLIFIILGMLGVVAFFALCGLALVVYNVKNLYPPMRKISLWAAKLENFFPIVLLAIILFVLIIFILGIAFALRSSVASLSALLMLLAILLLILAIPVGILLLLGITVYLIKLIVWLYARWQGLLSGFMPQIMRLKIKHEAGKDKDWTTHFAEMKSKLSSETDRARRKMPTKKVEPASKQVTPPVPRADQPTSKISTEQVERATKQTIPRMSLKDRMLMTFMSNKVVIKIMSIPIVLKMMTVLMKAVMWVQSLFSRKKKRKETKHDQPPHSGSPPPTR